MTAARWNEYPNFNAHEFDCKHTGKNEMQHEFMEILQEIRFYYGEPMRITSGYRHPTHPIEARKTHSHGEHTQGNCADISCTDSLDRFRLVQLAYKHGITRIGIAKTFLHFGIGGRGLTNSVMWEYQ